MYHPHYYVSPYDILDREIHDILYTPYEHVAYYPYHITSHPHPHPQHALNHHTQHPVHHPLSKEEQYKHTLEKLEGVEGKINKHIEGHESYLKALEEKLAAVQAQKVEVEKKIKEDQEQLKTEATELPDCAFPVPAAHGHPSKVFKKLIYITPEVEIEEQYDSSDPSKCYKTIKRVGQAPQVIVGEELKKLEEQRGVHHTAKTE